MMQNSKLTRTKRERLANTSTSGVSLILITNWLGIKGPRPHPGASHGFQIAFGLPAGRGNPGSDALIEIAKIIARQTPEYLHDRLMQAEKCRPQRVSLLPESKILGMIYSNNRANIARLSGVLTALQHAALTHIEISARFMLVVTAYLNGARAARVPVIDANIVHPTVPAFEDKYREDFENPSDRKYKLSYLFMLWFNNRFKSKAPRRDEPDEDTGVQGYRDQLSHCVWPPSRSYSRSASRPHRRDTVKTNPDFDKDNITFKSFKPQGTPAALQPCHRRRQPTLQPAQRLHP
ncbi:hypothetical protein LTR17_001008 [Elasticomyces elasticus]|nr:hypothetical protein LTR17_001008 [Elasticomyces elasticus]